jgi:hypothetical protein
MLPEIFTYSHAELAELARLNDATRAALSSWDRAMDRKAHCGATCEHCARDERAAYSAWVASSKALSAYAVSISTIGPK